MRAGCAATAVVRVDDRAKATSPTQTESPPMSDADVRERVADLHAHLEATAELAVDPRASTWLGEAEAVAGDAVGPDVPEAVVRKRVTQVAELLASVDGTGNEDADDRVAAARATADEVLDALDGSEG